MYLNADYIFRYQNNIDKKKHQFTLLNIKNTFFIFQKRIV